MLDWVQKSQTSSQMQLNEGQYVMFVSNPAWIYMDSWDSKEVTEQW